MDPKQTACMSNGISGDVEESNGTEIIKTFFSTQAHFPVVSDDSKIGTSEYLSASRGIVSFVKLLGSVFSPVSSDIQGNIDKLEKIHSSNPDDYKNLTDIIQDEMIRIPSGDFKIGTDALLWLTRAIEYVYIFLVLLSQDHYDSCDDNNGKHEEDLSSFFSKSYEMTLKKHHNWFIQKIFHVCLYAAPNRSTLVKLLSHAATDNNNEKVNCNMSEDVIFQHIKEYLVNLKCNIDTIRSIYKSLAIEF